MSILQNVFNRQYGGATRTTAFTSDVLDFIDGLRGTDAGISVTPNSSLGMPAVWRAVNLIAGSCGSLPFHVYQRTADVREQVDDGPAADLLDSPHPDMSPFEFWELVYAHMLLWGDAYLLKVPGESGFTEQLWPIHPARVERGRAPSDLSKVYRIDGRNDDPLTDVEILHIPGFGYDGIGGVSPIKLARQGIALAQAAEAYGAKLFGSGSLASGILKTDRRLNDDQAESLKKRWQAANSGVDHAHEIAVMDSGASFQQLSIPPEDAQFIESRKFQIQEIARMFGVPPHMLGEVDSSTSWGSGIEQQGIGFIVYTLRPWITRVEQRMTRLVREVDPTFRARYSLEGLLRGDTASRYASYATGRQWGWLSVNDVRALEELPPVAGGGEYISALNMAPIGGQSTEGGNP